MPMYHDTLSREDLRRFREAAARIESVSVAPSYEEAVESYVSYWELCEELLERYEIDPQAEWGIHASTGVISYD
jgi:hypothetical protein